MQPEVLFGLALGITPPWEVTEVSFSKESIRLDITIGFQRGTTSLSSRQGSTGQMSQRRVRRETGSGALGSCRFRFYSPVRGVGDDHVPRVMARLFAVTDTRLWRVINAYV